MQDDLSRKVCAIKESKRYLDKAKYNFSLMLAQQIAQALKNIEELFIFEDE